MAVRTPERSSIAGLQRPKPPPRVTDELLAALTRRVVEQLDPYAVILFGSHAWGVPTKDSDLDLLVILDSPTRGRDRVSEAYGAARVPRLPMDVLTYTPHEIAVRLAMKDFFIQRILERGRTLYERERPWEKIEAHPTMSLLEEWIEKAEGDYRSAMALNRLRKLPVPDYVCFHCQQSVEKYLKAFLIDRGKAPEKTHELESLLKECEKLEPALAALRPDAQLLGGYAVDPRHPGFSTTSADAKNALAATRRVRKAVRAILGL